MVWITKYADIKNSIKTLMLADSYLMADGTFDIQEITTVDIRKQAKFPAIQIQVVGDKRNENMMSDEGLELGGSSGNIFHRVATVYIIVYQWWPGATIAQIFNGDTTLETGAKYGIESITAYLSEFLTAEYSLNETVWTFDWVSTYFDEGGGPDHVLPHSATECLAFYQQTIAYS